MTAQPAPVQPQLDTEPPADLTPFERHDWLLRALHAAERERAWLRNVELARAVERELSREGYVWSE